MRFPNIVKCIQISTIAKQKGVCCIVVATGWKVMTDTDTRVGRERFHHKEYLKTMYYSPCQMY